MHPEELWTSDAFNARLCRTLLTPASWLYALGWQSYLACYGLGIKKAKAPHSPVVCIGNLQVGGTGKTPVTVHVADVLLGLGRAVVVSCSGYGSPASEAARLAPDGPLRALEWGDEAALIRWLRPALPLIVGRRRVLAAEICHREFPEAVLLMDDGFQHLPLRKTVSIVLDPPSANHRCLPAGPYREPWSNRKRADLVLPGALQVDAAPMRFVDGDGRERSVSGPVDVLCALGRPTGFLDGLRAMGLIGEGPSPPAPSPLANHRAEGAPEEHLDRAGRGTTGGPPVPPLTPNPLSPDKPQGRGGNVVVLPDHDPLTDGNLLSRFEPGRTIVVTGKDWVKLRQRADVQNYDFAIATREVAIEPRDAFRDWLQARIDGIPN